MCHTWDSIMLCEHVRDHNRSKEKRATSMHGTARQSAACAPQIEDNHQGTADETYTAHCLWQRGTLVDSL